MFQPLFLKIFYRGQLLKIRPFTEEQISIGSGEGLSLVLPGLAPWHILIEKKQDTYTVFDLGSESGTLLDGKKIAEEHELQSGSFLTLGEYQIQFFVGPPPQVQAPPPVVSDPDKESAQLSEAVGSDSIPAHSSKPVAESPKSTEKPSSPSLVSQAAPAIKPTASPDPKSGNFDVSSPHSVGSPAPVDKPSSPAVVPPAASAVKPVTPPAQKTSEETTGNLPPQKLRVGRTVDKPSPLSAVPPSAPTVKPVAPSAQKTSEQTTGNLPPQKLRVGRTVDKPPSPSAVPPATPIVKSTTSPSWKPAEGASEDLPPQQLSEPSSASRESLSSSAGSSFAPIDIPTLDSVEEEKSKIFEYSENLSVPEYKESSVQTPSVKQAVESPPSVHRQEPFVGGGGVSPSVGHFQKPDKKGFWRTFAPSDKITNLDEFLTPSIGNFIEVIVAWKNRILSSHHFSKGSIHMGSADGCEVPVANLLGLGKYKLLNIQETAQVFFQGVRGALIQGKERATRQIHPIKGDQNVVVKPYEMVRLDFRNDLKIYIRLKSKPTPVGSGKVFKFSLAEMSVLFFSFFLTGLLVFYSGFYAPLFLLEDEKFVEENIQKAVVKFTKQPPQPVDYALKEKTQKAQTKAVAVKKKKPTPKKKKKRASLPSKVKPKKKPKKVALKALGQKKGKSSASTRGKKSSKVAVGSLRPGGSLKTGKSGATAKTVAPDPTKMGLLGVFGSGGKLKNLDQGATGSAAGGLVGLAEGATGHAGTRDSYGGEGVGTKTKEMVSGGQGTALVGISGIKVKGRGGSLKGMGRGGLGTRGRMNIDIGTDDLDVEGTIDRAAILRVIFKNHRRFDHCYQASLQGNENLQGHLKMRWEILSKGQVRAAKAVQDGVGSRSLSSCVANVLKDLKFPVPPSGQIPRISFKFVFSK